MSETSMRQIKNFLQILFGSVIGIIIFVIFLPVILVLSIIAFPIIWLISFKFNKGYKRFLETHEGQKFFCYTSRKTSKGYVEKEILPLLSRDIEIIYLDGREPISKFPREYISAALYRIKNYGFPNIMEIVNGRMLDLSLKKELYETINQTKPPTGFTDLVERRFNTFHND